MKCVMKCVMKYVMKIKHLLSFLILCISLPAMASSAMAAGESPWDKTLPFETATVVYTLAGSMTGDKTIYVRDFGRTTAEYSTVVIQMFGMTQKQEEVIITTPDWVYSADLTEGTGTKHANMKKYLQEEYDGLSKSEQEKFLKNADAIGISTIEGMNGSLEKKAATILGYACDRVSAMGTTAYVISGSDLPLKVAGNTMGIEISQNATEIKTGAAPASRFELPQGIRFDHDEEMDRMMKEQAQAAVQNILQGNRPEAGSAQAGATYPQAGTQETDRPSSAGSQAGQVLEDDAAEVGQAAHQEAKDATIEEVREGVQNVFKSLFD